jgi:hypothetical protein
VVISTSPSSTFLYSGRKGVPAEPAENFVNTQLFAERGRYLATRVTEDRVTIVVLESLRNRLVYEVSAVQKACPGSLRFLGTIRKGPLPVFYRVSPDDACIGTLARGVTNEE